MKYGKMIGMGNTAAVYEWGKDKILKLFYEGYPKEAVEKEFHNAKIVENMDFEKPKAYEIVLCEERMGIIYDKAEGESLLDWVLITGDVQQCASYMSRLHKAILQHKSSSAASYKEFLKYNIANASSADLKKREEAMQVLDTLPDGNALCHGDFHPGNILIADGYAVVIDFMNVCRGDYLYDVARTVFLVEYTPVPEEMDDKEVVLSFKKALADAYLMQMNVTREMIQDYLAVIIMARLGECPNE